MIGYLRGKVQKLFAGEAIILTDIGVGYRIRIADVGVVPGTEVELHVHTAVRQDDITLWGFTDVRALQLFELLLSVSGVGLKTAFTLVTVLEIEQLAAAIANGDASILKVPGIGAKTAERIILDLRNAIEKLGLDLPAEAAAGSSELVAVSNIEQEALAALEALGYKRGEIEKHLTRIPQAQKQSTESLIRQMLHSL